MGRAGTRRHGETETRGEAWRRLRFGLGIAAVLMARAPSESGPRRRFYDLPERLFGEPNWREGSPAKRWWPQPTLRWRQPARVLPAGRPPTAGPPVAGPQSGGLSQLRALGRSCNQCLFFRLCLKTGECQLGCLGFCEAIIQSAGLELRSNPATRQHRAIVHENKSLKFLMPAASVKPNRGFFIDTARRSPGGRPDFGEAMEYYTG
jgi:hypothetical protein